MKLMPERTSERNLEAEYAVLGIDRKQRELTFERIYVLGVVVSAVAISVGGSLAAIVFHLIRSS
jgi:hypothetical protein